MIYAVKIPTFYSDRVIVFRVEAFQFSKFHINEAKHDKHNFKRGLNVIFKVKSS